MRKSATSSTQAKNYRVEAFPLPASMERRARVRFPLEPRVGFRTLGQSYPAAGTGWAVNISSAGVLVRGQHDIDVGTLMELSIDWPVLLHGRVPLQMVAVGTVVRCEMFGFAVGLERYRFRTSGGRDLGSDESCGAAGKTAKKSAQA